MTDNEKRATTKYEAPIVVALGEPARGAGNCGAGSGDYELCTNGNAAYSDCNNGHGANTVCSNGAYPVNNVCTIGTQGTAV